MAENPTIDDGATGQTRPKSGINFDEIGESTDSTDRDDRTERIRERIRNRTRRTRENPNEETEESAAESETIKVEEVQPKPRVKRSVHSTRSTTTRPVGRPRTSAKAELEKAVKEEAQQIAIIVLTMMNVAASNIAGPEAQMNSFERALIEPSIIRTFARSDEVSERITQYLDPIALCFGMTMWASRIWGIRAEMVKRAKAGYGMMPPNEPANLQTESPRAEDFSLTGKPTLNGYAMDDTIAHITQDSLIG